MELTGKIIGPYRQLMEDSGVRFGGSWSVS